MLQHTVAKVLLVLAGCGIALAPAQGAQDISDQAWLARVAYGSRPEALREVRAEGRKAYLDRQLAPPASDGLPDEVQAYLKGFSTVGRSVPDALRAQAALSRKAQAAPAGKEKVAALMASSKARQQCRREADERHVLRAVYSPWQLREQMAWFWFNHFNVFWAKGPIACMLADYEDAMRPHLLGNFRDLLKATLMHPAMQVYLDNRFSRKGKPNENYARELLELHTLGVDGGYTQADVQALAAILTGVGVATQEQPPKLSRKLAPYYKQEGAFQFNPARHDFSDKTLLGQRIRGRGWPEVEQVLDILVQHPATARHIARQLATYFVADDPPKALVDGAADVFHRTKGDIRATVAYILSSDAFAANAGKQFKSPMQYAISAVQAAGIAKPERAVRVIRQSLSLSGEPLYGRLTPDGYTLKGADWVSTGQLANRLAIARNVSGLPLSKPAGSSAPAGMAAGAPPDAEPSRVAGKANGKAAENGAGKNAGKRPGSRAKPAAGSPRERLFLELASPGFMYR